MTPYDNWKPIHLPNKCIICGKAFSTDHALSCPTGYLPTIKHNELRDFTANIITEVCHDVCIELSLQPISGEALLYATSTNEDEARLDIRTQGFWGNRHQRAFFDVRVFNSNAPSYRKLHLYLASVYHRQEREKQRKYEQRVHEVELGSFTPPIFSHSGGMAKSTAVAYKRLTSLLANKRDQPYNVVMAWLRCLSHGSQDTVLQDIIQPATS